MESIKNEISDYLSKWLMTALSDRSSVMTETQDFPSITKKVRDEVNDSFRRSGHWMTIKVLIQLNLTIEYGTSLGHFVYKLFILKILTLVCNLHNEYPLLDIDLMNQMMAKLARRIEKIMTFGEPMKKTSNGATILCTHVIDEAKAAISKMRNKIDRQINKLVANDVRKACSADELEF